MFSLGDICWKVRKLKILHFAPPKIWQRPKFKIRFPTFFSSWLVLHLCHVLWKSDENSRKSSDFHKKAKFSLSDPLNFDWGQNLKFCSQQFVHTHCVYMCIIFLKDSIKTVGGVAILPNCWRRTQDAGRRTDDIRYPILSAPLWHVRSGAKKGV